MTNQVTTLANGLRVATSAMSHVETVSLGVWVGAGARHEREDQHGLSHFLEHMAFKGTRSRSAKKIAEEIEETGGDLNASTGLETTSYFARVMQGDERLALDLLADILLNSAFTPADVEREREVITQEIAAANDSPDDIAFDLLQASAFPGQPVGRPILGTAHSVAAFQPADFKAFLADHYVPGRMVISAAGAIHHDAFVRHVEALFGGLTGSGSAHPAEAARYVGGVSSAPKAFEQSHVLIGFASPSYHDPDYFTAQVFSGLFGGGMSSRLFQEIREDRGLCYSIYSTIWGLRDTGMLAVHAATGAEMVDELAAVVAGELSSIARDGPHANELQRAKAQLKAGLLMGLESSSARADQMARHLMAHDRLISTRELVDAVGAVSAKTVQAFAARLLTEAPSVAVVGSGRTSKAQAQRTAVHFAPAPAHGAAMAAKPAPSKPAPSKPARSKPRSKSRSKPTAKFDG